MFFKKVLPKKALKEYEEMSFFTRKEILRIYKRWSKYHAKRSATNETINYITPEDVQSIPELTLNPFVLRFCEIFSEDGSGNLRFDEFLNFLSSMSEAAPREVKAQTAFRLYDFDNDGFISPDDVKKAVNLLTDNQLTDDDLEIVASRVMGEVDLDGDRLLSFEELNRILEQIPDFKYLFNISLV